jgi:hypothetical protein
MKIRRAAAFTVAGHLPQQYGGVELGVNFESYCYCIRALRVAEAEH